MRSAAFTTLVADTTRMLADLAGVTYRMRIGENRLVVGRDDDEPDYGAEVLATFARFRRSEAPAPLPVDVFRTTDMNPVEAGILERVARLHPAVFEALAACVERHGAFLDPAIAPVAAELPFYLGWLDLIRPLQDAGLPFCYPDVSATDAGLDAHGLFDLALALRRVPPGDGIVVNDLALDGRGAARRHHRPQSGREDLASPARSGSCTTSRPSASRCRGPRSASASGAPSTPCSRERRTRRT